MPKRLHLILIFVFALASSGCATQLPAWAPRASVDLKGVPNLRTNDDKQILATETEGEKQGLIDDFLARNELQLWLKWKQPF